MIRIWNKTFKNMTNWALHGINIKGNEFILDVGCGGGENIRNLSHRVIDGNLYGVDISSESVKIASNKNRELVNEGKVKILEGNVAKLPFNENYFDLVTAIQTHFYWEDIEKAISEIHRVLKEGGIFIIASEKYKINYHMKKFKYANEMEELLKAIGFTNIKVSENQKHIKYVCLCVN